MELVFAQEALGGWAGFLEPGLKERQQKQQLEPVLLVVPKLELGTRLKEACLRAGQPFAGIRICTPSGLRKLLRGGSEEEGPSTALREDLHLLMQLAGQQLEGTQKPARSAGRPGPALLVAASYVQIYDLLSQARFDLQTLPEGFLKALLLSFEDVLKKSNLTTLQAQEWALAETLKPAPKRPVFWLYGFSAADYSKWPLLYAALKQSDPSTARVCLFATGDDLWDSLWVEQWEAVLGKNALWLDPAPAGPFAGHLDSLEPAHPRKLLKLQCPNPESQAWAIVVQVAQWLGAHPSVSKPLISGLEEGHTRDAAYPEPEAKIAVIFPKNSPSSARVSQYLSAYGLKHYDGIGLAYPQGGTYELLKSYLAWQKEPRLTYFELFLKKLHAHGGLGREDLNTLLKDLRRRFTSLLVEELEVLCRQPSPLLEALMRDWPLLPEGGPLFALGHAVQGVLGRLEFPTERLGWIFEKKLQTQLCARREFATWLEGVFYTPGRTAKDLGQEAFARVQLLPWERVCGSSFSHVLIADGTQTAWEIPPLPLLEALSIQALETPQPGRLPLLTPAHTAALQTATLEHLVRSTTQALAVSFYETNTQGQPEELHPFFKHFPANSIHAAKLPSLAHALDPVSAQAIKNAQAGRQAPTGPENLFQYCTGRPLILSAKDWEATWRDPEQVFFEKILKSPDPVPPELEDPSRLAVGTWVHALLAQALGHGRLEAEPVMKRFKKALELFFLKASEAPHSLWELYFNQAQALATALLKKLLEQREGYWSLVEAALPDPTQVRIPGSESLLPLTGRIDLLLSQKPLPSSLKNLNPDQAYEVIDFKTGGDAPLSLKALESGQGLQVVLYGLALQAHGAAGAIDLLLLRPYDEWPASLPLAHTFQLEALWQKLLERHRFGCLLA